MSAEGEAVHQAAHPKPPRRYHAAAVREAAVQAALADAQEEDALGVDAAPRRRGMPAANNVSTLRRPRSGHRTPNTDGRWTHGDNRWGSVPDEAAAAR